MADSWQLIHRSIANVCVLCHERIANSTNLIVYILWHERIVAFCGKNLIGSQPAFQQAAQRPGDLAFAATCFFFEPRKVL